MKHAVQSRLVFLSSVALTTLLLGAASGYYYASRTLAVPAAGADGGTKPAAPPRPPAKVRVTQLSRQTITPLRSLVGELVEVRRSTIAAEVDGKIIDMPIEEGAPVVAGQTLLAEIDGTWRRLAIEQTEAQLRSLEASLEYETGELNRLEELMQHNATSASVFEGKQSRIKELLADQTRLHALLDEAKERQSRLRIIAPFTGSVVAKHADLGSYVTPGRAIADIVSSGRIDARIMVPESFVRRLTLGQEVMLSIDPLDEEMAGRIVSITASASPASRTFPTRVALDDQGGRLMPGMSVTAYIPTAEPSDELVAPKDAVLIAPDGATVWLVRSDPQHDRHLVEPVPVRVTARMRDVYAIAPETIAGSEQLIAGASVVIEGAERLVPGMPVGIDPTVVELAPVPGLFKTGQQHVDR